MNAEVALLLELVDAAYDKKAWHGPNLRGAIRRVEPEVAAWRPAPGRRNIWEIVVHAAYWKYVVRRRLLGEKRGSFPLKGSNWFPRPDVADEALWKSDLALLQAAHRSLRSVIEVMKAADLPKIPSGSKTANRTTIAGVAAHDVYHAGQIQTLKKLFESSLIRGG